MRPLLTGAAIFLGVCAGVSASFASRADLLEQLQKSTLIPSRIASKVADEPATASMSGVLREFNASARLAIITTPSPYPGSAPLTMRILYNEHTTFIKDFKAMPAGPDIGTWLTPGSQVRVVIRRGEGDFLAQSIVVVPATL